MFCQLLGYIQIKYCYYPYVLLYDVIVLIMQIKFYPKKFLSGDM